MKTIFILSFLCLTMLSCAQVKNIRQGKAFYYVRTPGTIPVDDNGVPLKRNLDTVTTIYLEIKGEVPEWTSAWKNGQSFTIIPTAALANSIEIGKEMGTEEKITVTATPGNTLWTLALVPRKEIAPPEKVNTGEILLQGSLHNTPFFYRVKLKQLASPEYM